MCTKKEALTSAERSERGIGSCRNRNGQKEDRAPGDVEVRLQTITVLSEPTEPMPLAVNKWKMNTSLEAMLNMRPIALRDVRERAKFPHPGRRGTGVP